MTLLSAAGVAGPGASPIVDSGCERSLSFATPQLPPRPSPEERVRIPVGPGRPAGGLPNALLDGLSVSQFPLQVTKVQRPPLREQTLRRDRLLQWLDVRIHRRLVLVAAEAGYGKTTLLSDFARRTRVRTVWYRLDEEDRDWFSFVNYLVAAGREIDSAFAPRTASLLQEVSAGGVGKKTVVETFMAELGRLGEAPTALILDDYYLVDDVPDIQRIVHGLIARAPERLSIVILTRRRSRLPVARLRALEELAELGAADLRFDREETERLFRETYGQPLEPDVVDDLQRRTEGWVASLQLVQTAVRNRTAAETRAFVRTLNGAHAELYDYLAEEVVGDLDEPLQHFLMTTSLLQVVDPELAEVVAGISQAQARGHMETSETLGLLSRHGEATRYAQRYHPLVRDFLETRLRRQIGDAAVADLHRAVARFAERRTWRLAAHHYAAAGDIGDLHRVLATATPAIMASGDFVLAESYMTRFPPPAPNPWFEIVLSRTELQAGRVHDALARARSAVDAFGPESAPANDLGANLALANLASLEFETGNWEQTEALATQVRNRGAEPDLVAIAQGYLAIIASAHDGSLADAHSVILRAAQTQEEQGQRHYFGISMLNLAYLDKAMGQADRALTEATRAVDQLSESSAGPQVSTARCVRAWALAHLGRWEAAQAELALAVQSSGALTRDEVLVEAGEIHSLYGDAADALRILLPITADPQGQHQRLAALNCSTTLMRVGQLREADEQLRIAERQPRMSRLLLK